MRHDQADQQPDINQGKTLALGGVNEAKAVGPFQGSLPEACRVGMLLTS
jgi:hypothetical protein